MHPRALRIRHYIGTVVAACSLGGLLLAFGFAFLFLSIERGNRELDERTAYLDSAEGWFHEASSLLGEVGDSLNAPEKMPALEDRVRNVMVELDRIHRISRNDGLGQSFDGLRQQMQTVLDGVRAAGKPPAVAARRPEFLAQVRGILKGLLNNVDSAFAPVQKTLRDEIDANTRELDGRWTDLWRTIAFSAAAYAALVLLVWRWAASRMIRPLQALTHESRRTLNGETSFQLQPDGPQEVRLLTESLSTLFGNLVGARANLEEKVKERTRELERANRAKNEFLANMSHEIRTPMTAILGYADLCLAPEGTEGDRRRYAEIIHANGEHLLSVINDILDVSKIEAGRMTVEPTLCSPFEVVAAVRALMEVPAREKGLALEVTNVGAVPELVRTDPTRLRQILLNLLNNAIKFTDQGSVTLRFHMATSAAEGAAEAKPELVFEVADTGVGLSAEQAERVFLPFVQADTSTTRKYGGSGLGLAISRTLARLLGGDLTCQSEPGRGSTFRVTIDPGPLADVRLLERIPEGSASPPAPLPAARAEPALPQGLELSGRVLLAEDVAVNRRLIATILKRSGIAVEEAENGRVALERALAARDAGQAFDIVFMDMQMPEMDGYEATRQLRASGYMRPIVALTSHSMAGERERCLEAGCDEYMTKPIDQLVLLRVLGRFLPSPEAETTRAA